MFGLTIKELLAVTAVGVAMTYAGRKVPVLMDPKILAPALYIAGYVVASRRPAGGWPMLTG